MKKLLSMMFSILTILSLCACKIEINLNGDGVSNFNISVDTKEECQELYNDYMNKTLSNTNFVVHVKLTSDVSNADFYESIDGTNEKYEEFFASNLSETFYLSIQDGQYYSSYINNDGNAESVLISKEEYDRRYKKFTRYLIDLDYYNEDSTFKCDFKNQTETKDGVDSITEYIKLTVTNSNLTATIESNSNNGLVETYKYTEKIYNEKDDSIVQTIISEFSFTYGNLNFEVPYSPTTNPDA